MEDRGGRVGLCDHSLRRGLRPVVYTPVGGVDGDRLGLHLHPIRGSRPVAAARLVSTSDSCHQCGDRPLHADAASGSSQEASCGTDAFVAIDVAIWTAPEGVGDKVIIPLILPPPSPPSS